MSCYVRRSGVYGSLLDDVYRSSVYIMQWLLPRGNIYDTIDGKTYDTEFIVVMFKFILYIFYHIFSVLSIDSCIILSYQMPLFDKITYVTRFWFCIDVFPFCCPHQWIYMERTVIEQKQSHVIRHDKLRYVLLPGYWHGWNFPWFSLNCNIQELSQHAPCSGAIVLMPAKSNKTMYSI